MTENHLEKIRVFRVRAEELRALARDWRNRDAMDKVLELAEDFERTAGMLESAVRRP
jgi:dsRNA-specific ribonuclease